MPLIERESVTAITIEQHELKAGVFGFGPLSLAGTWFYPSAWEVCAACPDCPEPETTSSPTFY